MHSHKILLFTIHTRLGVPRIFGLLIGLACGICYIAPFCSTLATMLGKNEVYFLITDKSGTAYNGSVALQYLVLTYNHSQQC